MGRQIRSFILFLLLFGLTPFPPRSFAETPAAAKPKLDTILKQIEYRHYRWVAFRADVILFLVSPGNTQQAMCGGELLYNRLDERMLLSCYDSSSNLVFIFRTLDRRFDLYMPGQNTLYHGSIFDLEDSPEIESHLKLIDLYRALKPGMFDPKHTEVDVAAGVTVSLNVFGDRSGQPYLSRKVYVTPAGDVVGELFFDAEGQTLTEIQRYDFQKLDEHVGSFKEVHFPKKITIVSPLTGKNTAVFFNKIKPLDSIDSYQFLLRIPKGTKEIFLKEVDPRFSLRAVEAARNKTLPAGRRAPEGKKEEPVEEKEGAPAAEPAPAEAPTKEEATPAVNSLADSAEADLAVR